MKKTMLMLFFAGFAAAQTETVTPNPAQTPSDQPDWCAASCIAVPVVNGSGYIRAVEKASHANEVVIDPFQFTKLRHSDGNKIKPGEAPERGGSLYLTMEDILNPPNKAEVAAFFAAEQSKISLVVPQIDKTQVQIPAEPSQTITPTTANIGPINKPTTKKEAGLQTTKPATPPNPTIILLADPGFFFAILSLVCLCIIVIILTYCLIRYNPGNPRET